MARLGLDEVQAAIKATEASWEAGETEITEYLDRNRADMRLFGLSMDEVEESLYINKAADDRGLLSVGPGPPPSVDWRCFKGQNCVTDIGNQKTCGACVAFATCAVLESRAKIKTGNPNVSFDLSVAHLFFCGAGEACERGWDIEEALEFCRDPGVGLEADFPYVPVNQKCKRIAPKVKVSSWDCKFSMESRKQTIAQDGPVIGGMRVYEDLYYYRGGVYRHVKGAFRGLHAVAVIGYEDSQECWIVKNSWGTGWGERGFMRISYGELTFPFYAPIVGNIRPPSGSTLSEKKRYDNVHTLNEEQIVAPAHEPIEIKVKGHGATGYMWKVATNASKVRVVDHKFEPDLTAFGAGGEESFILEALAKGETDVMFTLAAPWEDEPAEVHVIHLKCT